MPDIVKIEYHQTGESVKNTSNGMRPMAARAYDERESQYLLIKAPPASGKSRALMFLALDKIRNQGLKKVIVAVPERSIAGSFATADLKKENNFFANWEPNDDYNLCTPGMDGSKSKVTAFKNFMANDEEILICTHATLRFAFEELDESQFNNVLLTIDEFHHVSADNDSRLGELLRSIMEKSTAHVVAMTGSYFRGDSVPVLLPSDEAKFTKVTFNYYEQLNGYNYLKSLGIGYHFYQGKYTSAILDILDTNKKTILHIPNVNSGESTKDKHNEVDTILDAVGEVTKVDGETGIIFLKRHSDKKVIKVADLVNDDPRIREKVISYLRNIKTVDDMDLIIALGMAKEGFDWPFCEHALTVGYRGSLTEVIQIIGRCTRDSNNKTHAQFTNLIAQPDAADDLVKLSVNNMLKAITASLLMEQVLAPNFKFKTKLSDDDKAEAGEIKIRGLKTPSSNRVKEIIDADLNDLKANILQDSHIQAAITGAIEPETMNKVFIPNIIKEKYSDLTEDQVEEVRQYLVLESVIKANNIVDLKQIKDAIRDNYEIQKALENNESMSELKATLIPKVVKQVYPNLSAEESATFVNMIDKIPSPSTAGEGVDMRFIRMADKFVNIDDLHIDLIDRINPFQKAFEIISKDVTTKVLKVIQDVIASTRIQMTLDEALLLYPDKVKEFMDKENREPSVTSSDPLEKRMAEAIIYLKDLKRKKQSGQG